MTTRALLVSILVTAAAASSACGGGPDHVHVTNDVAVTITPATDELPFDPRGARLRAATQQLTQIAGHPVAFSIDAAVAAAFKAEFERQLIDAVERTARALVQVKKEVGEGPVAALRLIECKYVATVDDDWPHGTFDGKTGVLRLELSAHPSSLVPDGIVFRALAEADDDMREARYGNVSPDQVPSDERRAYFEAITRPGPRGNSAAAKAARERTAKLTPNEALAESPEAATVLKVIRLDELARGSDLQPVTRAWLFTQVSGVFRRAYEDRKVDAAALPQGSTFKRAEATYVAWLGRELLQANPAEQHQVVRFVYDVRSPDAYPGLDRFALGMRVADAWTRAGRPVPDSRASDPSSQLFDDVVCPSVRDARGKRNRNSSCTSSGRGWLAFVAADEARTRRLATELDDRDDPELTATLLSEIRTLRREDAPSASPDPFVTVVHGLDPRKRSWRAALEVMVESRRNGLRDESSYVWKNQPDQRGTAVYLLAKAGVNYTGSNNEGIVWKGFAKSYGSAIDAPTFASMLEWGRPAFQEVPQVWPALAPGFSRADVLVPKLDAFVPDANGNDGPDALRTISAIVTRLCNDRNAGDLAKLHAWIERRSAARPAERTAFAVLARDTAPGACGARVKKPVD